MTAAVLPPILLQNLAKSSRYALYNVLRMISMFISSRSSAHALYGLSHMHGDKCIELHALSHMH